MSEKQSRTVLIVTVILLAANAFITRGTAISGVVTGKDIGSPNKVGSKVTKQTVDLFGQLFVIAIFYFVSGFLLKMAPEAMGPILLLLMVFLIIDKGPTWMKAYRKERG